MRIAGDSDSGGLLAPSGATRWDHAQDYAAMSSGAFHRSPMGQGKPDQGCLHVPHVTSSLECDVLDTGEFVAFASVEHSKMTGRLGCPRIEGQPGAWPDATELPQEEPDRDRSPPRQIVEERDEGCRVGVAATDLTDIATELAANLLGERLEARGRPEVISRVPASVEERDQPFPFTPSSVGDAVDPGPDQLMKGPFGNPRRNAGAE